MRLTPKFGIPYPELTDPPDGPAQIQAAVTRIDTALATAVPSIQTGGFPATITNVSTITFSTTFPRAFPTAPIVVVNMNANAGASKPWDARVIAAAATNFTTWVWAGDNVSASFSNSVGWIATLPATEVPAALATAPPMDGWHYATATCSNPECPNNGVPVEDVMVPDVPEDWGWAGVICGACGQPITDIDPQP